MEIQTKYAHSNNYRAGRSAKIQFIVIHYTANNGDTAQGNCSYFQGKNRGASAHYFVDETSVWQSVRDTDTAWHCGGGLQGSGGHAYYKQCTNSNSLGIEMCSRIENGSYMIPEKTVENAQILTRQLMKKYSVPVEHVIRHYDVTGKACPKPWTENIALWQQFRSRLGEENDAMTTAERQEYDAKIQALEKRLSKLEEPEMIYNYIDANMPAWAQTAVRYFREKGILAGTESGLDLSDTKLWVLTILYRILITLFPEKTK